MHSNYVSVVQNPYDSMLWRHFKTHWSNFASHTWLVHCYVLPNDSSSILGHPVFLAWYPGIMDYHRAMPHLTESRWGHRSCFGTSCASGPTASSDDWVAFSWHLRPLRGPLVQPARLTAELEKSVFTRILLKVPFPARATDAEHRYILGISLSDNTN